MDQPHQMRSGTANERRSMFASLLTTSRSPSPPPAEIGLFYQFSGPSWRAPPPRRRVSRPRVRLTRTARLLEPHNSGKPADPNALSINGYAHDRLVYQAADSNSWPQRDGGSAFLPQGVVPKAFAADGNPSKEQNAEVRKGRSVAERLILFQKPF
jgi:hypothetical protein